MLWVLNNIYNTSSNFFNYFNKAPAAGAMRLNYERAIPDLPPEITQHIFSFLAPREMGPVRRVCREYRHLGSEEILGGIPALQKWCPEIKVIGPEVWNKYANCQALGIDPTGAFQPTTRALGDAIGSFYNQVEGDAGATVFTLPKGLTFNKLMTIARQHGVPERYVWAGISQQLGDEAVPATRIQVISNSILKKSRYRMFAEQQALCSHLRCEAPDVLTAIALVVLSYLESSDQPANRSFGVLSTEVYTYTCSPQQINKFHLVVGLVGLGGSVPRGFFVSRSEYAGDFDPRDINGVMALRKF